ncbi:ElyC/SanA/YdcF family protein [Psychromonas ossibalaenae]|uniref:ElyC/SanA/YdcF family protein n=1 Tax=Psychromonas ossibalaenae TaxID=444922 RepID=UPI00035EA788|nr:ElyC/SanA/YdcF family protein [Psychromonas ossibalaenae]
MLFILKKWIGGLLMPLPLLLILFFIGLILLFFSKKQKTAKTFLLFTFIVLFTLSFMPVSERIVHSVERKHLPIMQPAQNYEVILLLGSGGIADPSLPVTGQLSATALSRFVEALRLYNANPGAILVVSGSGFGDVKTHAQMMQELALTMNIPADKIVRLDDTLDTDDEARIMSEIIRGKRAVLVTSATHMDRSLQLFYKYGAGPEAAPANFLAKNRTGETAAHYYIPSARYLDKSTVAWHEYLGKLQNKIKGLL